MKCDCCGRDEKKMKSRKNYPHGRKSNKIITKLCQVCRGQLTEAEDGN